MGGGWAVAVGWVYEWITRESNLAIKRVERAPRAETPASAGSLGPCDIRTEHRPRPPPHLLTPTGSGQYDNHTSVDSKILIFNECYTILLIIPK